MTRKGMEISINLVIMLALAMIVILASAMIYQLGSEQLTEFFQGNIAINIRGGS